MKLLFFIGNLSHSGGTERVLSIVTDGLCKLGHEVTIVSLTGDAPSFFPINEDIRITWLRSKDLNRNILKNMRIMMRMARLERPDFWIDVDNILGVYSLPIHLKYPDVRWISWEHFNYYYPFAFNRGLRSVIRRLSARFADSIVVLSDEDKGYYLQNLAIHGRIERIYDPAPFAPQDTSGFAREKVILAAGRLAHVKGYDMLIDAWSRLEKRYPEWRVVIAGEGEERRDLEAQMKKAGVEHMQLIGNVRDVQALYRQASCFVLPSRGEGFGMVLVEAMSYGLPIVAFGCKAGVSEIVVDQETGYLVEPENVDVFASRVKELIDDVTLRERMGNAARTSVQRFSSDRIVAEWESLLQTMAAHDKKNGQAARQS